MGQESQNGGRNASLDEQKERTAGRRDQHDPDREQFAKGKTAGAFGKDEKANTEGTSLGEGGGGGGADPGASDADVPASKLTH